jgi:hypothetical protein
VKPRLLLGALLVGLFAAQSAQAATTTVSPRGGKAGSEIVVSGWGFPAGVPARVTLARRQVAAALVDDAGHFRASFEIPTGLTPGAKRLVAVAGKIRVLNFLTVGAAVNPVALAAASSGQRVAATATPAANGRVSVNGTGFRRGQLVRIWLDGILRKRVKANRAGAFRTSFVVGAGAAGDGMLTVRSGVALQIPVFVRCACLAGFALDFDRLAGGVAASDGFGTGFQEVIRYLPQNLDVNAKDGTLDVRTTSGDFFGTADTQDNALSVTTNGLNRQLDIETVLRTPTNATQYPVQAGLWFGTDPDNYVKLVALSRPSKGGVVVQLVYELNGQGSPAEESRTAVGPPGSTVRLTLHTNPNGTVTGSYSGPASAGTLTLTGVPAALFSAANKAGILATHTETTTPLVYRFESFSVVYAGPATPPPPPPPTTGIGTWTTKADMPEAVLDATGVEVGGKLYAVAGKWNGTQHSKSLFIYDPDTDDWSTGASLPAEYPAVEDVAAAAVGGKVYVFGGAPEPFSGAVTSAAVYDPGANTWTMLDPMPTARSGATAEAVGTKIYVIGGMDATGISLATVDVYDTVTGNWGSAAPMGTPRDNPGSAVIGGKIYVFGGRTRTSTPGTGAPTLRTGQVYDPTTNT